MKTSIQLLLISLILSTAHQKGIKCSQLINNEAFYELEFLQNTYNYNLTFTKNNQQYFLKYNFCQYINQECDGIRSYSSAFNTQNGQCIRLSSDSQISNFEFKLIDDKNPSKGIIYILKGGSNYSIQKQYETQIKINCNEDISTFVMTKFTQNEHIYLIEGDSKYGCPIFRLSEIYQFIYDYRHLFSLLLMFFSIVLCFYGLQLLTPTLFCIGYLSAFLLILVIFAEFLLSPKLSPVIIWTCILIAFVIGSIVGYFFIKIPQIAYAILGVWLGTVLSFLLNGLFFYKIQTTPDNLILYVMIVVIGAIFGYLSFVKWQLLAILNTSVVGAYGIVKSLSIYIGHFPDEFNIQRQSRVQNTNQYYLWTYVVIIIIFSLAGSVFQFRKKREAEEDRDESVELNYYAV